MKRFCGYFMLVLLAGLPLLFAYGVDRWQGVIGMALCYGGALAIIGWIGLAMKFIYGHGNIASEKK